MSEETITNYPDILTIHDIMRILRIGRGKVYELLRAGTIKSIRVGKKYLIPKKAVEQFLSI